MVAWSGDEPVTRMSAAQWVAYLLEPKNWIIATVVAVGWRSAGVAGLGWGVLAAFFAAGLPMLFITRGVARGRWDDRHVGAKRPRLVVLAFILASVKVSIHCAVASGSATILSLMFGPPLTLTYLLVALTAWSRVELKAHTTAQAIAGSVLGATAAVATYAIITH